MDAETKKAYLAWSEKGICYMNSVYAYDTMVKIDEALQKCDEILEEVGIGIGYSSRQADIDRLFEGRSTLLMYIDALNYYVDDKLDQPLYKDFRENATETISRIHLEDFEVDNTLGLTENNYISGGMGYPGTMVEQEKGKLTFADFIGTSDGKAEGNGLHMAYTNGSVEDFAEIFAGQYETMLAAGILGEDNELTQQEFLEQFYQQGEFTHDSSNPFLNFVSSVLDITIIKPIIEACTGEDLITGEDLTDLERGLKVVFAVVDLVTLGGAVAATKLSEIGLKEGLKAFGKTVLIDFAGNTAACGVGALGEAFDWPVPVTIMLSLAAGITVSVSGNKLLFKNADGIVIREKGLDEDEVKLAENMAEQIDTVISAKDRMKLQGWDNPPSDELYLKYKDIFDNPKYFDQQTGQTIWPGMNGDVNIDGFLNGKYEEIKLKPGAQIDRYGGNNGTYFAEAGIPIENRAMAPNSDFSCYNMYEVKREIPMRKGEIAPWFGQPGGGTQYQIDPVFVEQIKAKLKKGESFIDGLIRMGYLKRL